jgi:poly-gamma-glutamate capsule biosynthesis protein CapA/YwtB (metallophosphatase superfamily)
MGSLISLRNAAPILFMAAIAGCASANGQGPVSASPVPPTRPDKKTCVVLAVGDIMMGTRTPIPALPPDDGRDLFAQVTPYLKGDIVFANLEGVLADGEVRTKCLNKNPKTCFQFVMPTPYAKRLKEAGFNVVSINNNHSFDAGMPGLRSTMRTLDSYGIKHTGLIGDVAEFQVDGASVALVGFGFDSDAPFYNILDIPAAKSAIQQLKRSHRIVIVSFHGGAEGESALHLPMDMEIFMGERRGNLREFARAAVDAGADLVLGSSPHVPRAMELYRGRLIAYSLGNFETYAKMSLSEDKSLAPLLLVELNLDDGSFAGGRIIPFIQVGEGIPMPDPEKKVIGLMERLSREDIPNNSLRITKDGILKS